jgi:hypothetical protein
MNLGVYNKVNLRRKTYALYGFLPVFLLITSFFGNAQNGLTGIKYEGYYADNLAFFNTATTQADARFNNIVFTAINTVTPGVNFDDTYSVRFYGYFTATETSVHTFYTESDDASMLWIGNANETFGALETRRTAANAIVNNSGLHGMQERSGNILLVNGQSYPILVYFGENAGGDAIIVSFGAAGISKTNNGLNHYTSNLRSTPTITNFNNYTKTYFDGSFTIINPISNSAGAFSYASDNAAVATISGNTVTITGIGTANITATQAANATYSSGTATVLLTISGINVVSKYGGISTTNPNYVDKNGKIGGTTGISNNGAVMLVKTGETIPIISGMALYLDASNVNSYPGSGTTWTDISGNGNNGTLTGGVGYNNADGGSLVFDGVNDFFRTTSNLNLTDTDKITIQIILKSSSVPTSMVLEHSTNWNAHNSFGIAVNEPSTRVYFTDFQPGRGYNTSLASNTVTDGNWYFFTVTADRSKGSNNQNLVYLNGVLNAGGQPSGQTSDNIGNYGSFPLFIGSRAGNAIFLNANIAQVLIYKRVLTPLEIQTNFNALKARYGL